VLTFEAAFLMKLAIPLDAQKEVENKWQSKKSSFALIRDLYLHMCMKVNRRHRPHNYSNCCC
jgi:hypothetical protein